MSRIISYTYFTRLTDIYLYIQVHFNILQLLVVKLYMGYRSKSWWLVICVYSSVKQLKGQESAKQDLLPPTQNRKNIVYSIKLTTLP